MKVVMRFAVTYFQKIKQLTAFIDILLVLMVVRSVELMV